MSRSGPTKVASVKFGARQLFDCLTFLVTYNANILLVHLLVYELPVLCRKRLNQYFTFVSFCTSKSHFTTAVCISGFCV